MDSAATALHKSVSLRVAVAPDVVRSIARDVASGGYRPGDIEEWSARYGVPAAALHALVRDRVFASLVLADIEVQLRTIAAPIALAALLDCLKNRQLDPKLHISAAKTILDRAGVVAGGLSANARESESDIADMSIDELRQLVDRLEEQRGANARPIDDAETLPDVESVFES